jgi:hypothetical protein
MGPDVTRQRFTAGVSSDTEGNVRRPPVMLEARRSRRCGSASISVWRCYGRLAVVSDLDDGGFALNVDKELRGSAVL